MTTSLSHPVSVLDVTCPKCGVGRGLLCMTVTHHASMWRSEPHHARVVKADQAEASRLALVSGDFA